MNLQITIPKTWQKLSFEDWMQSIENKLKKQRLNIKTMQVVICKN
jgi:hypothetical protein